MRRLILSLAAVYRKLFLLFLRLKGQTPASRAEERVAAGKTWEDFCDTLKAAGVNVLRHAEVDMRTKAEGYRYLSRLTRAGLENFVEFSDPRFPELRRMVHETVKMGADNPDNHYFNAVVSGEYKYRIKGTRGTVKFLTFSTQKGGYGKGGGLPPSGFLDSNNLIVDDMGRFEIIASVTPESGNWLPMEPDTGLLMVRQTFFDRAREEPAVFTIECLVEGCTPAPLDAQKIDDGLLNAANLVAGASFLFSKWTSDFKKHPNALPLFDPATSTAAGGDPGIAYYHSYWRIAPDEALVVEVTPPPCELWNFQVNNYWMESLEYRWFTVHINKHTAVYNADGSVTVVVAHENPGVPNWLSTTGLREGTMCWRWIRAQSHPQPVCRVVKLAAVKD